MIMAKREKPIILKITRSRAFVVNMGNYESFRTEASLETDIPVSALYADDSIKRDYLDAVDAELDKILRADLEDAASLTDVKNSYILTWNEDRKNA